MKRIIIPVLLVTVVLFASAPIVLAGSELTLTATGSSSYNIYHEPPTAVDDNLNTRWYDNSDFNCTVARWLVLDCGDVYELSSISIWWYKYKPALDYDIQTSTDGATWTTQHAGLDASGGTDREYLVTYSLSGNARYVRVYCNLSQYSYIAICEVKIYGSAASSNQPPTADASADPATVYIGEEVQFSGSGADSDGDVVSYSWDFGDGSTSTEQNPTHAYNNSNTYIATLTVTDDDGGTGDDDVTVDVIELPNQPPEVDPSADRVRGEAPLTVHFTGNAADPDGEIVAYFWNFGDGATSQEQDPIHEYQEPGSYTAVFTVQDDDGAQAYGPVPIEVEEPTPVEPPVVKEIPHLIRFQGRVTDKDNIPLNGYYNITFRIYNDPTQGDLLWEELHDNIEVTGGVVNVLLGSINDLDLPFDAAYWLSVEVGGDGEMSPRQPMTSVGYSYRAQFAQRGGTVAYANSGQIGESLSSKLSIHLEEAPSSVKLYIWGEAADGGAYADDVTVEIDQRDKTQDVLSLANDNWQSSEASLGDGTSSHPLTGGTGELDLTGLVTWTQGEHTLEFRQTGSANGKIRYNVYISY